MTHVNFIDLKTQYSLIAQDIDQALKQVFSHNQYILGPEVNELEKKLAQFCKVKHALSCANGTDALLLILMAKNIQPNDAVLVPSFTFVSTAEVVVNLGAHPIFIDVCPRTFNMDPDSLKKGIQIAKENNLKSVGIISVDLFGQPADYDAISDIARQNNLWVLCDAAQSFGATYKGKKVGSFGMAATTSFFPSKPFGCYGDGGCIFTNDDELESVLRSLKMHGQGISKYDTVRIGINSRLDTMQAAILLEKLKIFPREIGQRQEIANKYNELLKDVIEIPHIIDDVESIWAQYTIKIPTNKNRDLIQSKLKDQKIPTAIYYPKPLHRQAPYTKYLTATPTLPISDELASSVLSLPMHPYINFDANYGNKIIEALK